MINEASQLKWILPKLAYSPTGDDPIKAVKTEVEKNFRGLSLVYVLPMSQACEGQLSDVSYFLCKLSPNVDIEPTIDDANWLIWGDLQGKAFDPCEDNILLEGIEGWHKLP